jgi:DNA repair protein RadD
MIRQGFQDRWYIEEAVQSLFDYFHTHTGNPLIAMPTGTGKSVVIAKFIKRAMTEYPATRAMGLTHVKELITQDANAIRRAWPQAPLGIYSAGLNQSDNLSPIVFGGVQSVVGKYPIFGWRDLLFIDEAHLLSPKSDTSYQTVIADLKRTNPSLKVIGLTATPYRLGLGLMTNGGIFTHIAYNLCNREAFAQLIAEGFMSPLIPKQTQTKLDLSEVKLVGGEFVQEQVQKAVDKAEITRAALKEVVSQGADRNCWLVFASGVEHAEHIAEDLRNHFGISAKAVHSKMSDGERDKIIEEFKTGKIRCLVNQNILTTGFDHAPIDLIAVLRPTMSPGLWVQMLGRGTRPYNGLDPAMYIPGFRYQKFNCLVLDFARNTERLGPIDDPVIPKRKGEGPPGDAPIRICEKCGMYNHASATECSNCGFVFPRVEKIRTFASELGLMSALQEEPITREFEVNRVVYQAHTSRAGNPCIKVVYYCSNLKTFFEYVTVEGGGIRAKKGRDWYRIREKARGADPPDSNSDLLDFTPDLRVPKTISVVINREYPEIVGATF